LIVFLTFSVIVVTLVLQGLTLPPLIRALGLAGDEGSRIEEEMARRRVLKEVIAQLEEGRLNAGDDLTAAHDYDDLLHEYGDRLKELDGLSEGDRAARGGGQRAALLLSALAAERRAILRLRDEGRIGDDVWRTLENEVDLTESRAESADAEA
jgi:CPA1 family monovalent cation:H+ antiporter